MKDPLTEIFTWKNIVAHFYGQPGSFKTTFLIQLIQVKLKNRNSKIYLIDPTGEFPIIRFQPIKHLLKNLVIFQPKTIQEEALLLDDLQVKILEEESILFIDDVFRHSNLNRKEEIHLNSYIAGLISSISKTLAFPVIVTNQARFFNNYFQPFLQNLTLYYFHWHFLFEKGIKPNTLNISLFSKEKFVIQYEYSLNSEGFIIIPNLS